MINLSIKMDVDRARRELGLAKEEVNKGAARAIERVAVTVRKEADQEIRKRLALASATVKGQITLRRPYGSQRLIRDIVASGRPIPIRDYQARKTRKGVTFRVSKAGGRKLYQSKHGPGFIVDKFGGNVFIRTGEDPPGPQKAKVRKVYGPSLPQYFVTRFLRERMTRVVQERWPIEFAREMKYRQTRTAG